jgi:hypothetical protein
MPRIVAPSNPRAAIPSTARIISTPIAADSFGIDLVLTVNRPLTESLWLKWRL